MQTINSKVTDVLEMLTLNCIKECQNRTKKEEKKKEKQKKVTLDRAHTQTISTSGSDSSYLQGIHLQQ